MKKLLLRNKIIIAVLLPVILLGVSTMFLVGSQLVAALEKQVIQRGVSAARNLAASGNEALVIADLFALDKMLNAEACSTEDMAYGFVLDIDGNVLAHTFKERFPSALKDANQMLPDKLYNIQMLDTPKGVVYDIAYPVEFHDKVIGTYRVGLSQAGIHKTVRRILSTTIGSIIAGLIGIAILTGIFLSGMIVKPVKKLHQAAKDMLDGNLDVKVDIKTRDEIQHLAETFNLMASNLKDYQENLEEKVKVATEHLAAANEKLKELSITDTLTGTYNRHYLFDELTKEFNRTKRYGKTFSVMILDIDDFKKVNDEYGHLCGDYVLREIAGIASASIRAVDILARYGGEEFLIILPEAPQENACVIGERIRNNIKNYRFVCEDKRILLTVSIGVCGYNQKHIKTEEDMIAQADEMLYKAKRSGKDCMFAYDPNGKGYI